MTQAAQHTAVVAEAGEADRQAAELAAMRRMIDASKGCFSLSVAVCNSPALRDYVIEEICRSFPSVQVVGVAEGTVDVFGQVDRQAGDSPCAALFVTNLEASLPSEQRSHPVLRSLNASRELWEKYHRPVVFWLPEYASTLLSIHARDFWRYRSHRFEFVSERAGAVAGMADRFSGDLGIAGNLSVEEKQFRIAELEQRLQEAGSNPSKTLAYHAAVWLTELGFLYGFVGDLDRAEEMLQKALQIETELGHKEGMATQYGNLGAIYRTRGDLDRAEEMHEKALQIETELGHKEGMAAQYGNLGLIYRRRGDLDRAEEMQQKALQIETELGHKEGMAADYGNLGLIYQRRGDLDRAEEMHEKSLQIATELGHKEGMAAAYGNLGAIAEQRGDNTRAREFWTRARDLYEQIGMPHEVKRVRRLLVGLPPADSR